MNLKNKIREYLACVLFIAFIVSFLPVAFMPVALAFYYVFILNAPLWLLFLGIIANFFWFVLVAIIYSAILEVIR